LKNSFRKWFFKEPWFERFFVEPEMVPQRTHRKTHRTMKVHLEPKMVLQSDAIDKPYLVPQRTFQTRVL